MHATPLIDAPFIQFKEIPASQLTIGPEHKKLVQGDSKSRINIAFIGSKKYFLRKEKGKAKRNKHGPISVIASKLARAISKKHFASEHLLSDRRTISRALPDTYIGHPIVALGSAPPIKQNEIPKISIELTKEHILKHTQCSHYIQGIGIIDEISFWNCEGDNNNENIYFSDGNFNAQTYAIKIDFNCCDLSTGKYFVNPDVYQAFSRDKDRQFFSYAKERFLARLQFSLISDCFIEALVQKYSPKEYQLSFINQIKERRNLAEKCLSSPLYGIGLSTNLEEEMSQAIKILLEYANERFPKEVLIKESLEKRKISVQTYIASFREKPEKTTLTSGKPTAAQTPQATSSIFSTSNNSRQNNDSAFTIQKDVETSNPTVISLKKPSTEILEISFSFSFIMVFIVISVIIGNFIDGTPAAIIGGIAGAIISGFIMSTVLFIGSREENSLAVQGRQTAPNTVNIMIYSENSYKKLASYSSNFFKKNDPEKEENIPKNPAAQMHLIT